MFISLLVQRNEPKKSRPWRFASRLKSGFPRRAPDSGVAMNSHIRALRQHDDPAPLSCTRLGCQTMGFKVKVLNPRFVASFKMTKSMYKSVRSQGIYARKFPIALIKVEPAPDHENIFHEKAEIINCDCCAAAAAFVQQRAYPHRSR